MKWTLLLLLLVVVSCAKLPGDCEGQPDQEICISKAALELKDPSACKSITNEGLYVFCISQIAAATQDSAVCEAISDPRSLGFCERDVVLAAGNSSGCPTIDHVPAKDSCYDEFARVELDWKLCRGISAGPAKNDCLDDISRELVDPMGCMEIRGDDESRTGCIWRTSILSDNENTCLEIEDMDTRVFCVANIVFRTNETSRCEVLADAESQLCSSVVRDMMRREGATFINDSSTS